MSIHKSVSHAPTVVVGLSGGVDSAVSAYLLKQQGFTVKAIFMQNWEEPANQATGKSYCTSKEDSLDAIAVADLLNIDIDIVNFAKEYKEQVFSYFLQEYQACRTPNPDVFCNSEIKFKAFLEYAKRLQADYIATGHYAGIIRNTKGDNLSNLSNRDDYNNHSDHNNHNDNGLCESSFTLVKAQDASKDQSYFLYRLNQYQLSNALFPLAHLNKSEVRQIASTLSLPNAAKKDSTGICFIGERPFREFLQQYLPIDEGNIVTPEGKIVGRHCGLMYYTIGQRKGLQIGGIHLAHELPWYVAAKDLKRNELIVVQGHDHSLLLSKLVIISDLSFIAGINPPVGMYKAKTRYRMQEASCMLSYENSQHVPSDSMTPPTKAIIEFTEAQWAITSGQSLVLYDGDICLGGGVIQ